MPYISKTNKYVIYTALLATVSGAGISTYYILSASEFQTYYHGSANVPHDVDFGEMVNGDVSYGLYCADTSGLNDSNPGDVYITGRAGSADTCKYVRENLLGIAIIGWANVEERVAERPGNSLTISNGGDSAAGAYGPAVDFHVDARSLSESMPLMANIVMEINAARTAASSTPFTTAEIRDVLIQSADGWKDVEGRRYGRIINVERAVDYAVNGIPVPPPSPPCDTEQCRIAAALAGGPIYLLLLD